MNNPATEFHIPAASRRTDTRSPAAWVISHAIQHWYLLLTASAGALGNAILASVVPVLIGNAFNTVLEKSVDSNKLLQIALLLGLSQVARGILQLMRNFGFEWIAQRVERDIRNELYVSLLGKSMTFHNLQPVGDTMARVSNDVREVNYLFNPGFNLVIGSIIFLIMPIIIAPRYNAQLIATPILFIIFYIIALRYYLRELQPVTDSVRSSFGNLNTRLAEALDGIETVKGAAKEDFEIELFKRNADQYRLNVVKQGYIEARFLPLLLLSAALAFGFFHAAVLFVNGQLNVGQVVAYFSLLLMLDFPTFTSLFAYSRVASGLAGARRILDLILRENNLHQNINGYNKRIEGFVEFRDATFSYYNKEIVIDQVSFKVTPGQRIAIVGQTGSGKTSIVKLINRTFDVQSGSVMIDGIDVRDWNLEALRRGISIIEQDIFLFSRTIADNIRFGKPEATTEEIVAAAKAAQADGFIRSFHEGYQTIIGERGVTLSGGQRQRIALARAFLTEPGILILDDSTSSIDSETEDLIQQAIFTAAKGRTTFIITHRLSQIRWADRIIFMRGGKLVAFGTHEELVKMVDSYRKLFSEK